MKKYILTFFIILALFTAFSAQAADSTYNPTLLPTSKLYFVKEWWRGLKELMIRNPVAKAHFELNVMEEKAIEAQKVFQSKFDDVNILKNVANNYAESKQKLRARLDSLKDNPNAQDILDRADEQIKKYDEGLLMDLTTKILQKKVEDKLEDKSALEVDQSKKQIELIKEDDSKDTTSENKIIEVKKVEVETVADCSNAPLPDHPAPPQGCNYEPNVCVEGFWKAGKMVCSGDFGLPLK